MSDLVDMRSLRGQYVATSHLAATVGAIMDHRECAYHPPSCGCQQLDGWEFAVAQEIIESLKDYYQRINDGCQGGADGPPPPIVTYFVESDKYKIFGHYSIHVTEEGYLFVLRIAVNKHFTVPGSVLVPLTEKMGEGDFANVVL